MNSTIFIFLVVFSLLPAILSQKLTREENNWRKENCGKGLSLEAGYGRKVLNGIRAKIRKAPWNVAIEVLNEEIGLCTGTLISTKHVITARHCFAHLTENGYMWNTKEELIGGCDEGTEDLILSGNFSDQFKVYAGTDCGYRKHCPRVNYTSIEISKIILPKVCDDKQLDFDDFAILELSENLELSRTIQPICVAHDDSNLFDNDEPMKLFGYGVNPSDGNRSAGPLRYEIVKPEKCFKTTKKAFCTKSTSENQLACVGDSGGGVVRMVNSRVTVVGVIYQGVTCEITTRNEKDYVSSVAYYSDDICKYTGICSRDGVLKRGTGLKVLATNYQSVIGLSVQTAILFICFVKLK